MKDIQVNKELPVITMNFEEVKVSLEETVKKYKGIVVTEEGLKDCKATQKELAGVRNKIDTYRKDVKREMEIPIKAFENQCKELIGLVSEAEQPIKEGINVFDDKRREEKKQKAIELIGQAIQAHGLDEKYSSQLTVLDKYLILNGSVKAVKEDIDLRASSLKDKQNIEKAKAEMLKGSIETTLESVNSTLKTPLKFEDFQKYIDLGWDVVRVMREINERAAQIREAEKPKEEPKPVERVSMPVDLSAPKEVIQKPKKEEFKFFVDVYVTHNFEKIQELSKFLQANGYTYDVRGKGKCKELN